MRRLDRRVHRAWLARPREQPEEVERLLDLRLREPREVIEGKAYVLCGRERAPLRLAARRWDELPDHEDARCPGVVREYATWHAVARRSNSLRASFGPGCPTRTALVPAVRAPSGSELLPEVVEQEPSLSRLRRAVAHELFRQALDLVAVLGVERVPALAIDRQPFREQRVCQRRGATAGEREHQLGELVRRIREIERALEQVVSRGAAQLEAVPGGRAAGRDRTARTRRRGCPRAAASSTARSLPARRRSGRISRSGAGPGRPGGSGRRDSAS